MDGIFRAGRAILILAAVLAAGMAGCGGGEDNPSGGGGGGVVDPNTVVRGSFTTNRQTYKTVKIGRQTWMAENLNLETDSSWCYDDIADSCAKYGRLYTWAAAKSACQSIGWRLPTQEDWDALAEAVGGRLANFQTIGSEHYWYDAGKVLKSRSGWNDGENGTDDYGFSGLPGGTRDSAGGFSNAGSSFFYGQSNSFGMWWTATDSEYDTYGRESNGMYAYYRNVTSIDDLLREIIYHKSGGYSTRCVKN